MQRCFWAFGPVRFDSLFLPICLSSLGGSSLPCGISSLVNLKVVEFSFVQLFSLCMGAATSKFLHAVSETWSLVIYFCLWYSIKLHHNSCRSIFLFADISFCSPLQVYFFHSKSPPIPLFCVIQNLLLFVIFFCIISFLMELCLFFPLVYL